MAYTPFGDWTPDQAPLNEGAGEALNVIATDGGYKPFQNFNSEATAIAERAQGAIAVKDTSGTVFNFCGTATKLYKLASDGLSWTDVSRAAGGAYATPSNGRWTFTVFGSTVIATNGVDAPQEYIFGGTGKFTALGGSPTISTYCATVDPGFVVLGRSGNYNTISWSGIENSGTWATSAVTMADSQQLPDGGIILGITSGAYPVILQEGAIRRLQFVGPPVVFRIDKVADSIGAKAEGSIASFNDAAFFLSWDGVYMIQGGQTLVPIGKGKVSNWIKSNIDDTRLNLVCSAIDPINNIYYLAIPTSASVSNAADMLLMFHWPSNRWTRASISTEFIYTAIRQSGYTLDTLDTVSTSIDTLPYSLDNPIWGGTNVITLGGFDTSHRSGFFTGQNAIAEIETGEFQIADGAKAMLRGFRPIIEGNRVTSSVTVKYRDVTTSPPNVSGSVDTNSYGFVPLRINARYHQVRVRIPSDSSWTFAMGIDDLKFSRMGSR